MSSDLQSIVAGLQFNNYASLVIATAVAYDYIITFPNEIKYIWNRSWTPVSTMFVLVRYIGLTSVLGEGLFGSTFVPGPTLVSVSGVPQLSGAETSTHRSKGTVFFLVFTWTFVIFLAVADIMMILRVYASYGQSRIVLGVLLVFYAAMIILYAIHAGFYTSPHYLLMTNPQVLNMSVCEPTYPTTSKLGVYKVIPRLILAALMVALLVARFCVESFQTYKVTKQWQANRYLNLVVKEGIFYFIAHLLWCVDFGKDMAAYVASVFAIVLVFVLSPRFIINVRELHLRNIVHEWDTGIDTGFGLSSRALNMSAIGFADSRTLDATEGDVEMQLVESTTGSKH